MDETKEESMDKADALEARARRLYLRANRLIGLFGGFGTLVEPMPSR